MSYADGYGKREYEDEIIATGVLTKQIDVKINGLRNKNARATYLSKSNRSVKLNAHIQATTFASTRSIVGFRLRYSPADNIFEEIQIPVIADYTSFKNVSNLTFNFSVTPDAAEVEKFTEVFFTLNLPPLSKQIYAVEVGYDNVSLGELCHSTVTKVGSGIKNRIIGMRLHTDFVIQNVIIFRRMAVVNLGVLENPTTSSTNYFIEFKMILRPSVNQAYPTVSMTKINARVFITSMPTKLQTITFSIINNPIPPITVTNSPQVNFYKIEPAQSEPMDTYNAIMYAEITWVEKVIYSPVNITLKVVGSDTKVTEQRFISVGRSLVTVIPSIIDALILDNLGVIKLPSVYVVPSEYKYDNVLLIKYSVRIVGGISFAVKLDVTAGDYTVTRQVNFSPVQAKSPPQLTTNQVPYWAIESVAISRRDTSVVRGAFNLLSFSTVIRPGARQLYKAKIYIIQLLDVVTLMEPKQLYVGGSVCATESLFDVSAITLNLNMGAQYLDSVEGLSSSRKERSMITFLVPLNVNLLASGIVSVSVTLQYGILSTQTFVSLPVIQPELGVPRTYTSYPIDVISFQDRPYELNSVVAPGQTVRIYNKIGLPNTMCTNFMFQFTLSSTLWLIDLLDAQLVSYSDFIWFSTEVNPIVTKYGAQTYNKITMNLGTICVPETYDNQVRIDLFLRPRNNFSTKIVDENITVSIQSILTIGTLTSPLSFPTSTFVFNQAATMKESTVILPSTSSDKYKLLIKNITNGVTFQPNTWTKFTFRLQTPFASYLPNSSIFVGGDNSSAEKESVFTINDVQITLGSNLPLLRLEESKKVYSSTYMKGQIDSLEIHLGNIVNTGILVEPDSNIINENDIAVEVSVRLADSKVCNNGTNVVLPIRVRFGRYEDINQMVGKVLRTGNELLNLQMDFINLDQNMTDLVYYPNNTINLRATIKMMNNSKVECSKQWLNIYHSIAVKSAKLVYSIPSDTVQFNRNQTINDKGFTRFEGNGFYFDNSVDLYLQLLLNEIIHMPNGKTEANLTIIAELVCITYNRNKTPVNLCNNPTMKRIIKKVVVKIKQQILANCEENLGLSNSQIIKPCQITSYVSPYSGYTEEEIRLYSAFGWKPFARPGPFDALRYITILFGQQTNVSRIDINLKSIANQVTMLHLMGTNDGKSFFDFQSVAVSYMNQSFGSIYIKPKFIARGIRIVVAETINENSDVAFTLELYGYPCNIQDDYQSSSNNLLRSYLYVNGYLFYCDEFPGILKSYLIEKRCFMTYNDADMKWIDMGPYITKILSYISPSNIIFAKGQNYNSVLISNDYGISWNSTNSHTLIKLTRDSNYHINSTAIPWTYTAGYFDRSITGTSCQLYQQSPFQFCFQGIYKLNKMMSDWNRVCSTLP
ncbi:hypothetical protein KSF78_0006192 [Schistosoma japonicum]|nr:hypothetical protein KSF78_0006192 [Schistosoma japonicum]